MDLNHCDIINWKISQEMFDSIVREVVEETGVPAANLVCGNSFCFLFIFHFFNAVPLF